MRQHDQVSPVVARERALARRQRAVVLDRPVTREHAAAQEVLGRRIERELEVAVLEPVGDAAGEEPGEILDLPHLDDPLDGRAGNEVHRHVHDTAEEPVAAGDEREEVGVLRPTAGDELARRIDERERLYVGDERGEGQSAPMGVCGESTADGETVGARLLLSDRPGPAVRRRTRAEVLDERGPLDPGLHADRAGVAVERDHIVEATHVEKDAAGAELLSSHRVPAGCDRNGQPGLRCMTHGVPHVVGRRCLDDLGNRGLVELRVDVVDDHAHRGGSSSPPLKVRSSRNGR